MNITIHGLDDRVVIWEGSVDWAEFLETTDGEDVLRLGNPEPTPRAQQFRKRTSSVFAIPFSAFSEADVSLNDCDECGTGGGGLCPDCKDNALTTDRSPDNDDV